MVSSKLKALTRWIIHQCREDPSVLGSVRLNKALWFTDTLKYRSAGHPVTEAVYAKRKNGPVARNAVQVLRALEEEGKIEIRQRTEPFKPHLYLSRQTPDTTPLLPNNLELAGKVVDFVCNESANELSRLTHDEVWDVAQEGEELPHYATLAVVARPPSREAGEWAKNVVRNIESRSR